MAMFEVFKRVIEELERNTVDYMIVGSIASMTYGEPRLTNDMDLVIEISPVDVPKIAKIFPVADYYLPPQEIITQEIINRRQFNVIHHESGLKFDLMIRKLDPHGTEEFTRKRRLEIIDGCLANVASPEDVIIKKLVFYQEGGSQKHIVDIKGILAQEELDLDYLDKWVEFLRLEKQWDEVNKFSTN